MPSYQLLVGCLPSEKENFDELGVQYLVLLKNPILAAALVFRTYDILD